LLFLLRELESCMGMGMTVLPR